ncbi:MAG: ankyrin repeat domain-containing protein [Myxococcota bacterium]
MPHQGNITALRQRFEILLQRDDQETVLDLNDLPQSVEQAVVKHVGALDHQVGVTVGELVSFLADVLVAAGDNDLSDNEYEHKFSTLSRKLNTKSALDGAFVISQRAVAKPTTIGKCLAGSSWMAAHEPSVLGARCGDLATVMLAISKDSTPRALERLAEAAAGEGHIPVLKALLDHGLPPGVLEAIAETAIMSRRPDVVEFLLDNGLSVDTVYERGKTLLMFAATGGYSKSEDNADIVRLLLSRGAKIDARNSWGESALHYAAKDGMTEAVRVLVEAGADINAGDNRDSTPLMSASFDGHLGVVRLLAQDPRIEINARSKDGDTALLLASRGHDDNVELIDALLSVPGIDVNMQDDGGSTAIMHAAIGHVGGAFVESTKRLLQVPGIDLSLRNNNGETVMDRVKRSGSWGRPYMVPILEGKQSAAPEKRADILPTYMSDAMLSDFESILDPRAPEKRLVHPGGSGQRTTRKITCDRR